MKNLLFVMAALILVASAASAQSYHDDVYIVGGYGTTTMYYTNGVWLADGRTPGYTHLTPGVKFYRSTGMTMDANNKDIVVAVQGTTSTSYGIKSGLFRVDPMTQTVTTIRSGGDTYACYDVVVNHDGDYVWSGRTTSASSTYGLYKTSRDGLAQTTVLTTLNLGFSGSMTQDVDIDPATGGYLFTVSAYVSSPSTIRYPVLVAQDDGTFTSINDGSNYGFLANYENRDLNWSTQALEGQYLENLYQVPIGSGGRTTLWKLGRPGDVQVRYTSKFDLQSAKDKRIVAHGTRSKMINGLSHNMPVMFHIDRAAMAITNIIDLDPANTTGLRYHYSYGLDFYRGRHVSTMKTGARKWDLNISVPSHAGKSYVAAISLAGYYPGIPLNDGRTIHLNPHNMTILSIAGLLKPMFDAGPGQLDSNGEAKGSVDLTGIPALDMPMWIAVVVLDNGNIAYIPDTHVMRI